MCSSALAIHGYASVDIACAPLYLSPGLLATLRHISKWKEEMGPTLIGLLQESVVKFASLAALKSPGPNGAFQTLTFAELYNAVKELGTGLIAIGLQPRMHVAMLAENNSRWLIADLAILGCAAVDVPVSTRMTERELEYVIAHADCDCAIVEDAAALHRILALRTRLPRLRKVIVIDFAGTKPQAGTTWLSVLPVWHSFERTVEYCSLSFGSTIAYSQPLDWRIFDDLRTLRPNYLVVVPALLESLEKSIIKKLNILDDRFICSRRSRRRHSSCFGARCRISWGGSSRQSSAAAGRCLPISTGFSTRSA